jgi:RNAse (barnase) inhibitor barstar
VNVVIDGRFVLNEADLHRRLADALGYGPRYRYDLDDLRKHLNAGDPRVVRLVWVHPESIRIALGVAAYDEFVSTLEEIEAKDASRLVFRVLG